MDLLKQLGDKHGTSKESSHHYLPVYDDFLNDIRDKNINLLEIGVAEGSSIRMWLEYFTKANIYGFDININNCDEYIKDINRDRFTFIQGDQSNIDHLSKIITQNSEGFDIIIDDASHLSLGQSVSLGFLFKHLKSGGIYTIEDLCYKKNKKIPVNTPRMIKVLINFMKTGKFEIDTISKEDAIYLEENIDSCELFIDNKICFIRKK